MSSHTIAQRFARSAGAAAFSQLWRVGVAFGVRLILRRYVPLAEYGMWEWCLTIYLILGAIRDLGMTYHVVRVKPRPYGNLLALELGWGGALAIAAVLGAPTLVSFYKSPNTDLVLAIQLMSLFLLFEGLASVPRIYFESELAIGRVVVPEMVRNLLFAAISVGAAVAGFGVWSLVGAMVLSTGYYAAHLWLRSWGRMPLHWAKGQMASLIIAGLPLAIIWTLVILQRRIGHLLLGVRVDPAILALYGLAFETTFLVAEILLPAVTRAVYPALVAFRDKPREMFEAYRLATLGVVGIEALTAVFLFVNAEVVVQIMGGTQYPEAAAYLRVLCFAPLLDPLTRLGGEMLKTMHKDGTWIACALLNLVAIAVGGWLMTQELGAIGMAWANYLMIGGLIMAWAIYRIAPTEFPRLLTDLASVYLAPAIGLGLVYWLAADHPWLRFGLSIAGCALVLAFYYWRYGRAFREFFGGVSRA